MSCNDPWFTYFYKRKCKNRRRKRSDEYNQLSIRYKRRNRRPRYSCKKHKDFCVLMDSFGYNAVLEPLSLQQIKHKLQPFLLWLKRHYELVLLARDPDCRSGFETYGYTASPPVDHGDGLGLLEMTDEESIKGDLSYISDRWQCSFRVRWLINLLEPEYAYNILDKNT